MTESAASTPEEAGSLYEKSSEELEKAKQIQELRNLSLSEDKTRLEIKDLERGFFRRTNAPALIGMVGTVIVVAVAGYTAYLGIEKLRLQDVETINNKLQADKKELETSTGALSKDVAALGTQKENAEKELTLLAGKTSTLEQGNSLLESAINLKQGENENLRDEQQRLLNITKAEKLSVMSEKVEACLDSHAVFWSKLISDVVNYYEADERLQLEFRELLRNRFAKSTKPVSDDSLWKAKDQPEYERGVLALILFRVTHEQTWREVLEKIAGDYVDGDGLGAVRPVYAFGIGWLISDESLRFAQLFHLHAEKDLNKFERQAADTNMDSGTGERLLSKAEKAVTLSYILDKKNKDLVIRYLQDVRSKALAGDLEYISLIGRIAPSARLVYLARSIAGTSSGNDTKDKLIKELEELMSFEGDWADLVPGYSVGQRGTPANWKVLETTDWSQWLRDHTELVEIWVTDSKLEKLRSSDDLFKQLVRLH